MKRLAVVIIHGIGEQKPMSTLRGFVSSLTQSTGEKIKYYNKPDTVSDSFELRRLTTSASDKDDRPKTDFFEYYWAYNMRDTKLDQVLKWIWELLFRWPWTMPKRIRAFHVFIWLLFFTGIALIITGALDFSFLSIEKPPVWVGVVT